MAQTYDFIIVGAGSAGCVLADRLTASGRHQVLLVEAGGSDRRAWIKVPVGYAYTFADPAVNWRYTTEADPGLDGREGYWPRGKVIGGSSSINAMAYVRGLPHDFDDWEAAGAKGWNWETVKARFDALECNLESGAQKQTAQRGTGPVVVSSLQDRMNPFTRHFLSAAEEMGWPVSHNMNAAPDNADDSQFGEGLTYVRSTVKGGLRWSAADAFLRPALKRPNLTVIRKAQVERVLLNGKRATGIRYRHKGRTEEARAARDVILSAGAVNSPQLLMLSGIGNEADLKTHGIALHHALPEVGKGLQDHLAVSHLFRATEDTLNAKLGTFPGKAVAALQFALARRGPLSVPVNQCSGFARTRGANRADVQVYCNPASYGTLPNGKPYMDRDNGYLLCVQPCRPTSRGEISLRSADPTVAPVIKPNSLATEEDRATAIRASRLLQDLAMTPALQAVTRDRCAPDIVGMDDYALLENFRTRAGTVFHPTCTCRMGDDPNTSVVDSRLRVHGLSGLRVIDASAFPNITSGNTNAPTLMLADKAADMVLEDTQTLAQAAE
ncbi:GMC family oxidoreductase N-terminal domain-containing protein [Pelagimonas sp. KU-00592-HH]|uniref:GMC family oxidoreductase n=1 Tax=Pelagimonas sp. KU-00592-HH TaxID=3127651 RepID=UPI00310A9B36